MPIGRVVSVKNKNTATLVLESTKTNRLYKKSYVSTKNYLVDDSLGVKLGDVVEFVKCKPVSKKKHWKITKVLGTDVVALGTEHMQKKAEEAIEEVLPEERQERVESVSQEKSKESEKKIEKPETKKGQKK